MTKRTREQEREIIRTITYAPDAFPLRGSIKSGDRKAMSPDLYSAAMNLYGAERTYGSRSKQAVIAAEHYLLILRREKTPGMWGLSADAYRNRKKGPAHS